MSCYNKYILSHVHSLCLTFQVQDAPTAFISSRGVQFSLGFQNYVGYPCNPMGSS
eukprot:Gb_20042 [translate_table: standard]